MNTAEDWFATAVREQTEIRRRFWESRRSAEWFSFPRAAGEAVVARRILQSVRNVVRNQGVPRQTDIRLAAIGDIGAGAAGFRDAPAAFKEPFILLERSPYDLCSRSEVMDVYCGIGLHEAGHILHTREGYRRRARPGRSQLLNCFDNLLEDDRIERLICEASPGYAPYIEAARKKLLEEGEFGRSQRNWDLLPSLDRILALICAFIRVPHLIGQAARQWCAVDGTCVFEALRQLLPQRPQTEQDVERMADLLLEFYTRLKKQHSAAEQSEQNPGGDNSGQPGTTGSSRPKYIPGRFRECDLVAGSNAHGEVDQGFSDEIVEQSQDGDDSIFGPRVVRRRECKGLGEQRVICEEIAPDSASEKRYQATREKVADLVTALRMAIPAGGSTRRRTLRDRSIGRIDPRRIARAPITERIFRVRQTVDRKRLAVGLLLDASGSMEGTRSEQAFQAAVLFAEAFAHDPRVDLHVYSHTSPAPDPNACLIRTLLTPRNPQLETLGTYQAENGNFDYLAISTCHEMLQRNSPRQVKRVLIVVSDGMPCGGDNLGKTPEAMTVDAVRTARTAGTLVLGIGIDGHNVAELYGERWTLNIKDCQELPSRLGNLLVRVLRGS